MAIKRTENLENNSNHNQSGFGKSGFDTLRNLDLSCPD